MSERVLHIVGGWKKIPDTYMRTLGYEDAEKFHRQISPADRLAGDNTGRQGWRPVGSCKCLEAPNYRSLQTCAY